MFEGLLQYDFVNNKIHAFWNELGLYNSLNHIYHKLPNEYQDIDLLKS